MFTKCTGGGRARIGARHVCCRQGAAANLVRGGGRRGHGAPFGVGDGESRVVRGNARARRVPCRARSSATLAPAASQSRARPASRFPNGTRGSRARRSRPAADRRCRSGGLIGYRTGGASVAAEQVLWNVRRGEDGGARGLAL